MKRNTFKFKVNMKDDIEVLQKELDNYKKIKIKFTKEKDKYSKEERENFMDNFYNAKLNILLSIIDYYVRNKKFEKNNNPFNEIKGDEVTTYQVKLCDSLADFDLARISKDDTLTNIYCDISARIKEYVDKEKDFVRDVEILREIIIFYHQYITLK